MLFLQCAEGAGEHLQAHQQRQPRRGAHLWPRAAAGDLIWFGQKHRNIFDHREAHGIAALHLTQVYSSCHESTIINPFLRSSCVRIHPVVRKAVVAQVDKAFEYLERASAEVGDVDEVVYQVRARRSDAAASGRGILLREPLDGARPVTCMVDVKPVVHAVRACAPLPACTEALCLWRLQLLCVDCMETHRSLHGAPVCMQQGWHAGGWHWSAGWLYHDVLLKTCKPVQAEAEDETPEGGEDGRVGDGQAGRVCGSCCAAVAPDS